MGCGKSWCGDFRDEERMAQPYSDDLRAKLLDAYEAGVGSLCELAAHFRVSWGYSKNIRAQQLRSGEKKRLVQLHHCPASRMNAEAQESLRGWLRERLAGTGRLALWACCLAPLMGGTMQGQAAPAPLINLPSMSSQSTGTSTTGTPSGATPGSSAVPVMGQNEIDISSPRAQDRAPDQTQGRLAPLAVAPASLTEFQQFVVESTGRTLPIFGARLFNSTPSTFAPVDNIPVTPDYVIGPGDELRIQIWGQVNQRGSFVVDRTGSISLPEVGTVHVAGVQFSQLSDFLKSQLGHIYRNFDLNVNLGQLRSIQVFVAGQARQAGSFTIGSLSTLLNALFASGGPLPQGSLRDIQVKRGGETITHFDLYDLLLHGDKTKDVRLESGDVIFIPNVGPQVAVMGSVTTPAIYELRGEKNFNQMIALAGGLTNVAADSQLRVERIYKHRQRSVIDIDLATGDSALVQDGDIVNLTSVIDKFYDAVTLRGNVANPGRYVWHQGMRISDLIPNREALVTRNYYQRQNQLGQGNRDYRGPMPEGSLGIQSSAVGDAAATRTAVGTNAGGSSVGATLIANNSPFGATTDVILSAPDIDWNYAVIDRQNAADLTTSLLPFNLGKVVLDKDAAQDLELLSGDVVTIFSQADIRMPSEQQTKFVKLEGEFAGAGVYSVLPGETLRQLLARAGGLSPDAYLFASEFTRESVRRLQRQRLLEYADELESQITARTSAVASSALTATDASAAAASADTARAVVARLRQAQPTGRIVLQLKPDSRGIAALPDIALEDGDRFVVPRTPATVSVQGQVYNSNTFIYQSGKRVKDYLRLAGGPDRVADRKREFILRADGSVVSYQYGNVGQRTLFAKSGFDHQLIFPGDTIIVPPMIEKGALMREILNISTILQGFGIGAAAINVLK
jgi:protein involved in polysaccharide export with SLBB domain